MSVRGSLTKAFLASALLLGSLPDCVMRAEAQTQMSAATLRGTVTIKGTVDLPPNAQVSVVLEDVSLADAPAITLSKTVFSPVGGQTFGYALGYDPSALKPGHHYALRADIRNGTSLLYISKEAVMGLGAVPDQTALVVEAVASPLPSALVGNWVIDRIGSDAVDPTTPAFLTFRADGFLSGTGGCNRLMGRVTASGNALTFGPMAGTRMACPGSRMSQEDTFFAAARKVVGWQVDQGTLLLTDAQGDIVLTLSPNKTNDPHKNLQNPRIRKSR
ncbi:META domain-containing protein [Asaia krungthepensis]|nr:META domain-containing protein [Asaia krungthepensis]